MGYLRDHLLSQPESYQKKKNYHFGDILGEGAFGKVVRAHWKLHPSGTSKDVAMKVIQKKRVKGNEQSIFDEMNILQDLDHPNIIKFYEYFESRDHYYLSFEIATGGELFDRIAKRGRFSEKHAAELIKECVSAIAHMHSQNIVHRDIKPENILYRSKESDSEIVIADFGIAQKLKDDNDRITTLAGSIGYAPPEILNSQAHGKPVDMWSIGVITYVLLCGYSPFRSEDLKELIIETERANISFHDKYWTKISDHAKEFIKALLQSDASKRLTADQALRHEWFSDQNVSDNDVGQGLRDAFSSKEKWRTAFKAVSAMNRFGRLGQAAASREQQSDQSGLPTGHKKFDFNAHRSLESSVAANAAKSRPANEVTEETKISDSEDSDDSSSEYLSAEEKFS